MVRARLDALENLIQSAIMGDFSPSGDLSGNQIHQTVIGLQTNPLAPGVLGAGQSGYILTWVYAGINSQWTAVPPVVQFTAGGDLSGMATSQTVIALQGNAVKSGALSTPQDGYVLTWINSDSEWEARPTQISTGTIVRLITTNYNVSPSDDVISIGTIASIITVTLESAPITGRTVIIKDANGLASTYNITINGNGKNIDGNTNNIITQAYGSVDLIFNGNKWISI